tara:strand:+ start:119 stop:1126 length:1008 start_codon:yes stop_codon:yes gene_type:complete
MSSTFTSNLTLEKPGSGEQSNSWGTTLNTNLDAIDTAIGLRFAGTPNNNVAASYVGQVCVDSSNKIIYIATTAGNIATAVWTPANVADATVALTGVVTGSASFSSGNASINTVFGTDPTPTGVISMFGGSSAPSGYLLCNGADVSRTTYSDLFTAIGTTHGSADVSTFKVPDFQERIPRGKGSSDNLGDTNGTATITPTGTISSVTPSGSVSISGSIGNHSLTTAEIPEHYHYVVHNNYFTTNSVNNWTTAQMEYAMARGSAGGMGSSDTHNQTVNTSSLLANGGRSSVVGSGNGHNHNLSASGSFSGNSTTPTFTGSNTSVLNPYLTVNYIIKT